MPRRCHTIMILVNPVSRSALTCDYGTNCCSVSSALFRPCCQSTSLHSWHAPSRPAPSLGTSTPQPSSLVPELPQWEWPAQELVLEQCSAASSLATPGNDTCLSYFPCRDFHFYMQFQNFLQCFIFFSSFIFEQNQTGWHGPVFHCIICKKQHKSLFVSEFSIHPEWVSLK